MARQEKSRKSCGRRTISPSMHTNTVYVQKHTTCGGPAENVSPQTASGWICSWRLGVKAISCRSAGVGSPLCGPVSSDVEVPSGPRANSVPLSISVRGILSARKSSALHPRTSTSTWLLTDCCQTKTTASLVVLLVFTAQHELLS